MLSAKMHEIPVVDLSLISPFKSRNFDTEIDSCKLKDIAKEIGTALHSLGFVYLVNHGLDQSKIDAAFRESKTFFEQPLDNKIAYRKNNATKGYHGGNSLNDKPDRVNSSSSVEMNKTNDEIAKNEKRSYEFDLRESFDFAGRRGHFPEDETPNFHTSLLNLEEDCKPLVKLLFKILGIALELEDVNFFVNSSQWIDNAKVPSFKTFRSLYYPSIPDEIEIPPGKARVKEHADFGFLTVLFQDSVGGLEIKTIDGNWIEAAPIEGSVLINIGSMLDVWTGGYFMATKHRVLIPEAEIKRRTPRQSIVYFVHPDSCTLMKPLKSKLLKAYDFQPRTAFEHAKQKLAAINSY